MARPSEHTSNFLQSILYTWVNPLFTKGNAGAGFSLTSADLLPLSPGDSPALVSTEFEAQLTRARAEGAKNPVTSALWSQFYAPMVRAGLYKFTKCVGSRC